MSNQQDTRPQIWRSIAEKVDPRRRERLSNEETGVQVGSLLPDNALVNRRTFLSLTGAAAATVGISGCIRRPAENILPYTVQPEYALPGVPLHFATCTTHRGEAIGLLVESHEGRPTKIEGNPEHPSSRGRTDAHLQARILDLYDNDRSGRVRHGEQDSSWAEFDGWWRERAGELGAGAGLRILIQPSDSPSIHRAQRALAERFPEAIVHTWAAIDDHNARMGANVAFGGLYSPVYQLGNARGPVAKAILALDCDMLAGEPGFLGNARGFAQGRAIRDPGSEMNRLYAVESTLTVTGMNADHRLRIAPSQADRFLRAIAAQLGTLDGVRLPPATAAAVAGENDALPEGWRSWVEHCAADLAANRGRSLVCVGWRQPHQVHALAHALNAALGNVGATVQYFPAADASERHSIAELTEAMGEGVDTLLILGGNPVYDAPADLGFGAALANVAHTVHLSSHVDETSGACEWHLPMAHELESWGDHQATDGTVSIQQPLIAPLRGGRAVQELLAMVAGIRAWRGYNLVRNTMRERYGVARFERTWRASLHSGVVRTGPNRHRIPAIQDSAVASALTANAAPAEAEGWEVVFIPSYQTWDGGSANNPWMQELPDPVTKMVWGNAAYLSVGSARELGLIDQADLDREEYEGSFPSGWLLDISTSAGQVSIPAIVVPSHADRVITLPLGFGRAAAGSHGDGVGVDVYPIRTSSTLGFSRGVEVRAAGGREVVVVTQDHHSMTQSLPGSRATASEHGRRREADDDGVLAVRPLAIDATLEEYRETPNFAQYREPTPTLSPLWTQVDYSAPRRPPQGGRTYQPFPTPREPRPGAPPRYKWGMVLDLTTCTGCSACVIACQAENNIAFVGRRQVALGREMHWMRLDRYFVGSDLDNPQVAIQPVGCQQCEEAPCENVCPVAATSHSPEGLNDMAYNRCIGTRYCQNNCPYKVRRFNFLDWHGEVRDMKRMVFNPNVTVRMRGVMEKCSYCVQRIQYARIQARVQTTVDGEEINERRIRSEEVQSACAQACPSGAIIFGDMNDTESEVHRMAHLDRQYSLIAAVGAQPRTVYLGKIRNPNPEMV